VLALVRGVPSWLCHNFQASKGVGLRRTQQSPIHWGQWAAMARSEAVAVARGLLGQIHL
jgi:hypothetical protein